MFRFGIWEKFQVPKKFQSKVQEKLEFPKLSNVEFGKSSKFQRSSRTRFDKVRVNVEFGKSSSSHRTPQEGFNKSLKKLKVELQSLSKVSVPNNFHRKVPLKFQLAQINSNLEFGNIKIPPTKQRGQLDNTTAVLALPNGSCLGVWYGNHPEI